MFTHSHLNSVRATTPAHFRFRIHINTIPYAVPRIPRASLPFTFNTCNAVTHSRLSHVQHSYLELIIITTGLSSLETELKCRFTHPRCCCFYKVCASSHLCAALCTVLPTLPTLSCFSCIYLRFFRPSAGFTKDASMNVNVEI